jgi:signal transduction histidine kinase
LLEELGLADALRWLAQQTEQISNKKLQVLTYSINRHGVTQTRASDIVELAFYRVAQEALSNVLKHAQASKVVVRLCYSSQGRISLVIADNGRGFRMGDPHIESLGIIGMHERMGAIGGRIQIHTQPGQHTIIRATYTPDNLYALETDLIDKTSTLPVGGAMTFSQSENIKPEEAVR